MARSNNKLGRRLGRLLAGSDKWREAVSIPCYIYVIEAQDIGLVKVGISENVDERLRSLQEACPVKLTMYLYLEARNRAQAYKIEQKSHQVLADARQHGEWFKIDPHIAAQAVRDSWIKPESLWDI